MATNSFRVEDLVGTVGTTYGASIDTQAIQDALVAASTRA